MTFSTSRLLYLAFPVAVLTLVPLAPARADFFDGARRTFTTDIPHFFQDDIPCAFGGKPTSGARTSCRSAGHPAKHATDKDRERPAPAEKPDASGDAAPSPGQ